MPFAKSSPKRLVQHPKFYFFDNGILGALLRNFALSEDRKGMLFENLFFSQLMDASYAADKDLEVSSFRKEHGAEIDFVVEIGSQVWAIECKSAAHVAKVNAKPFQSFSETQKDFSPAIAYMGTSRKVVDGMPVYPWMELIQEMGL